MKFLTELKNDLAALSVLSDWLGSGMKPVDSELSESRAIVCASCPMNQRGNWWDSLKSALADRVRQQIELRNRLKVRTSLDDLLGTCKVCSCVETLKIHAPIEHVKAHTTPEQMKAFPDFCWVKKEAA